uniref:NADH-ubiquinone oxidoreductase chain 6 n=1 Tax=Staphylinidae sp. BMNH 1274232 TaxID=1796565 RepID=A0A126TEN8_9COLE|nr:NADH dehydrogenase subunit 6 [Staphylinidae sp. BMNH 1274232]
MIMLMLLNFFLSTMFMLLNHPMTIGMMLLIQTCLISMITGLINMNFWFSYILFLIMIGGMLVLFIYMTSIASNEMFSYSSKIMMYMIAVIFMSVLTWTLLDPQFLYSFINYKNYTLENYENNYNLSKFFNYPSIFIMFMMIIYLFITLIATVKITKIEFGPLRQNL